MGSFKKPFASIYQNIYTFLHAFYLILQTSKTQPYKESHFLRVDLNIYKFLGILSQ